METKRGADALEDWLCRMGFPATTIHGDRTQQVFYASRDFSHPYIHPFLKLLVKTSDLLLLDRLILPLRIHQI